MSTTVCKSVSKHTSAFVEKPAEPPNISSIPINPMSNASTPAAGDSLRKRYLFKLIANAAGIPLYFVLEALMPRALGPAAYGNFSFATNVFLQFSAFLDMGTSTCLATTLSKNPHDDASVARLYARIAGIDLPGAPAKATNPKD